MYCLDTNIVIDFLKKDDPRLKEKIGEASVNSMLCITVITACELYQGAYLSPRVEIELLLIDSFIDSVHLVGFNKEACKQFGREYAQLRRLGKMSEEADIMIASIAKVHGLVIVTRNKKHFEHSDVKVEVW